MLTATLIDDTRTRPRPRTARTISRVLASPRQLSPQELGDLVEKMVNAPTESESLELQRQIMEGFYGEPCSMRQMLEYQQQALETYGNPNG